MRDKAVERCRKSDGRLLDPLLAIGNTEYPLDANAFVVPFAFRLVDVPPKDATNPYSSVHFTRIALNRSNSEGFFAISTGSCDAAIMASKPTLDCGGGSGSFLHAYRTEQGGWRFEPTKGDCPFAIE